MTSFLDVDFPGVEEEAAGFASGGLGAAGVGFASGGLGAAGAGFASGGLTVEGLGFTDIGTLPRTAGRRASLFRINCPRKFDPNVLAAVAVPTDAAAAGIAARNATSFTVSFFPIVFLFSLIDLFLFLIFEDSTVSIFFNTDFIFFAFSLIQSDYYYFVVNRW